MAQHHHGACGPGPSWLTAALLFVMSFVTMISPAAGVSNNTVSIPTSPVDVPTIPYVPIGTADAGIPAIFPRDGSEDIFVDPDCDPRLVLRQFDEDEEEPDCPCCYSRDGGHLPPYQTPDISTRIAVATASWTAEHSLWQATATIPGEPVPTDEPEIIEFEVCANCPDGRCMFGDVDRRRQVDSEEDDDDEFSSWPSSDEDELAFSEEEDQDPTTATDILKADLTHPAVWQYGADSWWDHMYSLVINRGARFGPPVPADKTDPALFLSGKQISHASMIRFDSKDEKGNLVRVDEGLAGGIIPMYGCTGVVVATDRGVYTAHIWEAPTFMTVPGRRKEDDTIRKLHWDLGVNQFFASGNKNIVSPPSPALADLVKEDGPLSKYAWMQVHLFGVKDHSDPNRLLYDEKTKELEKELQKYLGEVPDKDFFRHIYDRNPPRGTDGTVLSTNEYYREHAGHQLVAWQYAPKEAFAKPGGEKLDHTRAFRLWFNKRILTTRRWCDEEDKNCEEVCEKERPESDPKRATQVGGMGKQQSPASGSGTKPKGSGSGEKPKDPTSGDKPKEPASETKQTSGDGSRIRDLGPAAPRSLVPRVPRSNPRLPPEFTQMFPDKFTGPDTWPYGSLDWWKRMYTVAVKYGATGEAGELLNIVSGDDYHPNHCVYRDLPNLGRAGTGGGVTPLYGCSGVVVASNKGVYMGHFWERPNFMPAPHFHQERAPHLYANEEALWERRVNGMLRNGWKPYFEDAPWGPSLEELAPTILSGDGVNWLRVWILHPDRSRVELTGEALYSTKIGWLKTELKRILPINDDNIQLVTYMKYNTEAVSIVGSDRYYAINPGIHMFVWQFAPDTLARNPRPNFRYVNAIRVFWDRREIWYQEWCPAGKDCSAPAQVYCSQRATSGPSKQEALAVRQDPAPTDNGDQLPYEKFFISNRLSSPSDNGTDPELWWQKMYTYATEHGAGMHEYPYDDFYSDQASFLEFGGTPEATGIAPMWGCTGVVVMSDKGVYTARFWEVPNFFVPYDPEPYEWTYDEDSVWKIRVEGLLADGFVLGDGERTSPSLAALANGTNAFAPSAREWLHVEIITPKSRGNSTDDRPLYFQKIAKLRDSLVSIVGVQKDDVKVKTYTALKSPKAQAINGTSDHFAETEEQHEARPGANMLGIQYAPAQLLHNGTSNETTVRAVRLWWDRDDYFTLFWCNPFAFADFPLNSNVTSEIRCIRPGRERSGEIKSEEVCSATFVPTLYPYDNMRAELYVGFAKSRVVDGERDLSSYEYLSSHTANATMGSMMTIPRSATDLAYDFSVRFGQSWERFLWSAGSKCKCDEKSCDIFSPSCCSSGSCPTYACNCEGPDDGGELCWPDQRHVAGCCLDKEACPNDELRSRPYSTFLLSFPWENFEHGLTYGNESWSTGHTQNVTLAEYPPPRPFCAMPDTDENSADGYNNVELFGTKELSFESSFSCYFACGHNPEDDVEEGEWEGRNVTMQFLPSVPLADDAPGMYEGLEEPLYNNGQSMGEEETWTTGVEPIPAALFGM